MAFLDPENFQEVLHARVMVNLGQYCCNGFQIDRFLVADDKPNDTLINYSFIFEKQTVGSEMHFRITLYVGEALDYCSAEGHPLYLDLNAYRVLIIEDGDTRLSCFGLIKNSSDGGSYSTNLTFTPPEYLKHDRVYPEIINSFGTALLDSLSGNRIPPSQDHMVRGKNLTLLMDSHLEGKFSTEQGTVVVDLASECLQCEPREWPGTKDLVVTFTQLQSDVPSDVMLQSSKLGKDSSTLQLPLSPMHEACLGMDLATIHHILVITPYEEDEGKIEEPWSPLQFMQGIASAISFLIYCILPYSMQCKSGVFVQIVHRPCALSKLNLQKDFTDMLNEGALMEEKRHRVVRVLGAGFLL